MNRLLNTGNQHSGNRRRRPGAAFLLLVVALLLVVTGATLQLVKSETMHHRAELAQWRAEAMQRAVDAVAASGEATTAPIRLPIDDQQSIEVNISAAGDGYVIAQWIHREQVVDQLRRPLEWPGKPREP